MLAVTDYPVDIFVLIFRACGKDLPLIGCFQLSPNARKAITKLGLNVCRIHPETQIHLCDRCQYTAGCVSACECFENDEFKNCRECGKFFCRACDNSCGYCSDPAGWKPYYCKDCSQQCFVCKGAACDYCNINLSIFSCSVCDNELLYHEWCMKETIACNKSHS